MLVKSQKIRQSVGSNLIAMILLGIGLLNIVGSLINNIPRKRSKYTKITNTILVIEIKTFTAYHSLNWKPGTKQQLQHSQTGLFAYANIKKMSTGYANQSSKKALYCQRRFILLWELQKTWIKNR